MNRAGEVRRVLDAARVVAEEAEGSGLVHALEIATGLSPEGVRRALERHLETDATEEEIASLVRWAGEAPEVTVILSANVFVGALRAIAIARAAAPKVVVRPSRREPVFARALVSAMRARGDEGIRVDTSLRVEDVTAGELHVYGRDATIADVQARARPGVRVRGHGSGLGVAFVSARAAPGDAARALADDVVAFDQQGCLSPRLVLVEGDFARADAFGAALDRALEGAEREVPRGHLPDDVRAEAERWTATMAYAGNMHASGTHAVAVSEDTTIALPPTHRHVWVGAVEGALAARAVLAPLARAIVAFGSDDEDAAAAIAPAWARRSALGFMQRPRLDGPVDKRG